MTCHCPRDLTFPWQPHFYRHVFQNFSFSYLKVKIKGFLQHFFKYLDVFMMFLFVLITFEPILGVFLRIWANSEIQDGGPRWPPFSDTL